MSIAFKGLRTSIYRVNDVRKATAWYSKVLGIEPYFNEPLYVGFHVGGHELGLQPDDSKEPKTVTVITYWGVDDVTESFSDLITLVPLHSKSPKKLEEELS